MPYRVEDFQPGDVTVTPVLDGFLIGKVLPRTAAGPWWSLVFLVPDETHAVREAVTLALAENTRVWFQEGPGRFKLVETTLSRPIDTSSEGARF